MIRVNPKLFEEDSTTYENIAKISESTGLDRFSVIGRWTLWLSFRGKNRMDRLTSENVAELGPIVYRADLDRMLECQGFAKALIEVGWIEETPDGYIICSAIARQQYADHRANIAAEVARSKKSKQTSPLTPEQQSEREARREQKRKDYEARTGKPALRPGEKKKEALTLAEVRKQQKR